MSRRPIDELVFSSRFNVRHKKVGKVNFIKMVDHKAMFTINGEAYVIYTPSQSAPLPSPKNVWDPRPDAKMEEHIFDFAGHVMAPKRMPGSTAVDYPFMSATRAAQLVAQYAELNREFEGLETSV